MTEIRGMLEEAGLAPQRMFGQNFLIDSNLLSAIVEMSGAGAGDAVVEIGPGTGALTDHLLDTGATVLAVEIDRGLAALLRGRYADQPQFRLMECDVLAGKHAVNPDVIAEANKLDGSSVHIVGNLPYNIATSLVCELLLLAVAADRGEHPQLGFSGLTITIQREVAQRLAAGVGEKEYGPASVLVGLFGSITLGKHLPAQAFWPRPKVASQVVRIDAKPPPAETVADPHALQTLVSLAFGQRRKKIAALGRRRDVGWDQTRCEKALNAAGIDPDLRPERIEPAQFAALAKQLGPLPPT